jgi:putative heme-binding domain-containing protein
MIRLLSILLFSAMGLLIPSAAQEFNIATKPLTAISAEDLSAGQDRYGVLCARCHGMLGEGGEGPSLKRPRLSYAPDDESLKRVIGGGIPGTGMPGNWALGPTELHQVAGYVKSLGQLDAEEAPGDAEKGQLVYETKGNCSACHILRGVGKGIGPELSEVGLRRNSEYLYRSITNPSADQPKVSNRFRGTLNSFLTVRAVSEYGTFEGLRINEDEFSVQMRDMSGKTYSFDKAKLISYEKDFGHSLMPGYGALLNQEEADDMVSFLMTLKGDLE